MEPPGINRREGKRLDGVTIIPRMSGRPAHLQDGYEIFDAL